jgi:raffinose/stachyose/melibiose transport system permease protein
MKIRVQHIQETVKFLFILILALLFLVPFILVAVNSFKSLGDVMTNLVSLPDSPHWENYADAWRVIDMPRVLRNTTLTTFFSVALILFLSSMTAYWIVRHPTRFSQIFEKLLIGSLLIPFASIMLPLIKTLNALGISNSFAGGILSYTGIGMAFATFIVTGSVRSLPLEVEEAARIDGCNVYQIFFLVVLPMLMPTLVSVLILDMFWVWNDYIIALVVLNNNQLLTIQLAINRLFGQYSSRWNIALPAIVMSILPIIIANIVLQKKIVSGMTQGAIKG